MLIDEACSRETLRRIVGRLTSDPVLAEELVQEGLVHLWLLEERRPGQTRSWYLQNCKFHLQNYLKAGRSIDSRKREAGRMEFTGNELYDEDNSDAYDQLSARDILSVLADHLSPRDNEILKRLADGLGVREIADQLRISHPAVIKHRRRIAILAQQLGIPPLPHAQHDSELVGAHE